MSSIERRLKALEVHQTAELETRNLSPEALRRLSDEELDALEDALENALENGAGNASFEDLYAAVSERSRRGLEAYFDALEAAKGESPAEPASLSRDPPEISLEEGRNAYRIWKYSKHGK
jgi:hypothetical protein